MNLQWYPGHMTKAKRQMMEDIKLIDLVIELIDARIPYSGRNPDIDELSKGKSRLVLLNKSDLSDKDILRHWIDYFQEQNINVLQINSKNPADMKLVTDSIATVCSQKIERDRKRGIKNRPVRAMVVGIPNVGKSTFINSYAKRSAAKTGNKPGVTKGRQWIRLSNTLELLDTPGILWPKFEDQAAGLKIAFIGSINDDIINKEELAFELINFLNENYQGLIENKYGINIEDSDSAAEILYKIAVRRGCLLKGSDADTLRAANIFLENFRNGKLGPICLDRPDLIK